MVTEQEVLEAEEAYCATFDKPAPTWTFSLTEEEYVAELNKALDSEIPLPEELESERKLRERADAAHDRYMERFGHVPWSFRAIGGERLIEIVEEALRTGKEYVEEYKEGCVY
jgi:hypothetical protein